jgi:glycosyltransferase involved in cell wall biosynthesis
VSDCQDRPAPRVSVAISTWNRAHLVGRAIRSALAQTFEDFELLIVDDGSSDATPEVLAGVNDARLRRIRHERNYGISRTRNTALGLARGEWMAFLDDDNEWTPDYLERQLALAASRPGAGVVYCRACVRNARSGVETAEPGELWQGEVFCHLVDGWTPFMSGALIRVSALAAAGGLDETLRASEDRDLWMRLAQRTAFAGMPDVLLIRHMRHGVQLSFNPDFQGRDAAIADGKWRSAITAACGRKAYHRWRLRTLLWVERCRLERAAEQGSGERVSALRSARRLLRLLPGSAPHVVEALGLAILGSRRLEWVTRRLGWYGYRARKALGLSTSR